jgi:hypothetical protein
MSCGGELDGYGDAMADDPREGDPTVVSSDDPNSLAELLQELRILLQGTQLLAGFLIVLPFSERFAKVVQTEKSVYLATFLCTITSLLLFSTPAIHHRLQRPLVNRIQFKNLASRMMIAGAVPLTIALVLATQLATSEVLGERSATVVAGCVGAFVLILWWILPFVVRNRAPRPADDRRR